MRALLAGVFALLFATAAAALDPAEDEPPAPTDFAADRVFPPGAMAAARAQARHEHGGEIISLVSLNIAEIQIRKGAEGYRWEGEAWYGGDINRAVFKLEGEGNFGGTVENAELQALYSRAVGPYFNLQAGIRHDVRAKPSRTYATVGVEGLAPYWFEVDAALFLSEKGEVQARLESYYDLTVTQRLVLQPLVEISVSAQDVRDLNIGAGVSTVEGGLRLRYEIRREFAPYIGITHEGKVGQTAAFARRAGEPVRATSFVAGIHMWF